MATTQTQVLVRISAQKKKECGCWLHMSSSHQACTCSLYVLSFLASEIPQLRQAGGSAPPSGKEGACGLGGGVFGLPARGGVRWRGRGP